MHATRVRGVAAGALTAALAISAHGAAGGALPSSSSTSLLALFSATLGALVATTRATADVKVLVAVLAVGQLLGHALLGAAGHSHSPAAGAPFRLMVAAHLTAVAVGAALIAAGERLCIAVSRVLTAGSRHAYPPVGAPTTILVRSADQPLQSMHLLSASLSHRGPPVSLAR
ncbi:hypothetical protein [Mycolicibacterium sp.]|uniref:hypothetical protein n=1 Tax=Mycolicibacterium sp. TaxID=2320850 RepID=UPI001A2BACAF|nr:hypothetical protein [Mycolicibacterium sp.]MBJ7341417.1 hypothetical protein [Mycolicibacterium sp.]